MRLRASLCAAAYSGWSPLDLRMMAGQPSTSWQEVGEFVQPIKCWLPRALVVSLSSFVSTFHRPVFLRSYDLTTISPTTHLHSSIYITMHASTVAIALFAATQAVLAAPTPASNARSFSAIGDAITNFAEEVVGPHIGKRDLDERSLSAIENFFSNLKRDENISARSISAIEGLVDDIFNKRSLSAIENFFSNLKREELDARSLSAIGDAIGNFAEDVLGDHTAKRSLKAVGAAVAGGVASGVAGAIGNAVLNNKRTESGLMVDSDTGIIYMDVPDANEGRSLKAVGAAVAGGVASGVAGAIGNAVLNNKRGESGLMVDTETGTIYMDVPGTNEDRSLKAVGAAVAGGVASGVAGAIGNAVLNNKRGESGLMVDTDTGVIYMDVPDANGARSLKAVGTAVAGGVAAGVAGAVGNAVLGNRDVQETEARSLKAVGAAVAGGVASGVAGAVGNAVLNNKRSESGLMVDTDTGVIYMDVPDAPDARSLKAVGAAVAGGVASGVAGAIGNAVLNNKRSDSGLMVDTDTGVIYMDIPDANGARSLKAVGTALAGGAAALATGAVANEVLGNDKRSLSAIENFFENLKRDDSAQAINHQIKQVLQRSELEEMMAKRAIDDLE
ncbi:unnamed protein product [Peniophora sp. CBMAI 1063]|nr:unnamed protein product [Peniophora sp. CBMAI 1063]